MNIFITGAESGIGNEIAQLALLQGHKVFATYLVEKNINKLDSENVFIHQLNVTDPSKIKDAALIAKKELGSIDVLINVAGVSYFNNPVSTTDKEWRNTIDVNVSGYFFLTRELLPLLKESPTPHIINMSSIWRLKGSADMYSYSVSKHAVQGLTVGLREYCKPLGIKVSNIILDKVDTDFRENMEQYITISEKQKSCMIKASNIAETVMFLLNSPKELLISSIALDAFLWE